ncbi:MAG: cell division protein FtsL [Candidatus Nitrotoga sp.]
MIRLPLTNPSLSKPSLIRSSLGKPSLWVVLFVVVIISALSVVALQHKARKLFVELQKEKDHAHQMEVEWGQLQLEQSTWAMSARVENIASARLQMQIPQGGQTRILHITTAQIDSVLVNSAPSEFPSELPSELSGGAQP